MQVILDIPDSVILTLSKEAMKQDITIEEMILSCLSDDQPPPLADNEINPLLVSWLAFAYKSVLPSDGTFTLRDLATKAGQPFEQFHPSDRKKFGKRFIAIMAHHRSATNPKLSIVNAGKTVTNSMLYRIVEGA